MTLTAQHLADLRHLSEHSATPLGRVKHAVPLARIYALERKGLVELVEQGEDEVARLTERGEEVLASL